MSKRILITGATDGIGLETAKRLAAEGHTLLLHGRNPAKLTDAENILSDLPGCGVLETYIADFSRIADVEALANSISAAHEKLDVLINNAGVYKMPDPMTPDGMDARFVVNTLAPYLLTKRLRPLMSADARIVNLWSAAQAPVNVDALLGRVRVGDMDAYAQSKLALTMWSRQMGLEQGGPLVVAVNPGSLLASKMVKEGFGVAGSDLSIGADILVRASLSDEFADASGAYFDNDAGHFGDPHLDALDSEKSARIVEAIEEALRRLT